VPERHIYMILKALLKFSTTKNLFKQDFNNLKVLNFFKILGLGTHLFVKVPRPEDSEGSFSVFESSCHLLLVTIPVYNTQRNRDNPVKCFAQGHNKRICRPISTLTLLNAERQARKL